MLQWIFAFVDALTRNPAMPVIVNIATLLVLILTLYWVREYTLVARRQYEASYRPIVIVEITQGDTNAQTVAVKSVQFRNVGLGPALDVEMTDWNIGQDRIKWDDPPGFLAKGERTDAKFFVTRDGEAGGFARDLVGLCLALQQNPEDVLDKIAIPFTIRYRDAADTPHSTQATAEREVVTGQIRIKYHSFQ